MGSDARDERGRGALEQCPCGGKGFLRAPWVQGQEDPARISKRTQLMIPLLITTLLLSGSNVFMTFAWYAHLRNLSARPWYIAVLASWGIALFEYTLMVPANRIGYTVLSLPKLKIMQEVLALTVFVPFLMLYMK